jgi:hypothetical protein
MFGDGQPPTVPKSLLSCYPSPRNDENIRKSLRQHSVRDRGVGGSNPLAPTNKSRRKLKGPGNRAFSMYASACRDVPGSVAKCGEPSSQLPVSLPGCYRKAVICPDVVIHGTTREGVVFEETPRGRAPFYMPACIASRAVRRHTRFLTRQYPSTKPSNVVPPGETSAFAAWAVGRG